ncbi:MAG: hypothetical protein Q9210_004322 [Variospora velana]
MGRDSTQNTLNGTAAHECVCDDALVHLKSYKYSSVDKSLISRYILKHYWNGFVELLPLWLAPNMVTLLGFFCILANVILLEIFMPDLVGPGPSWLYYSFAFGVWMYSTMDNVDGKQARRTGQSSGLGELFEYVQSTPITDLINWPGIFGSVSLLDIWFPVIFGTFLFIHLPACIVNVVKARRANDLPVAPVFKEWLPIIIFTGSCTAWLYSPYSTLMQENRLVLFCLTMSFVFGRMTTKIILAHLTRQPFPLWTVMLAPLIGGAVLGNLPLLGLSAVTASVELWYLRAYFVFALVVYFRWALLVINSICDYLGINCLTITPKAGPHPSTASENHQTASTPTRARAANGPLSRKSLEKREVEALNGRARSTGAGLITVWTMWSFAQCAFDQQDAML